MRFIKIGNQLINLNLVTEIEITKTGISFWLRESYDVEIPESHSSYEAVSAWLAAGMPIHTPFLDVDLWFEEQSKPNV